MFFILTLKKTGWKFVRNRKMTLSLKNIKAGRTFYFDGIQRLLV